MQVSVVITTFNSEDKIEETLKSVKDIAREIIVVDSSPNDRTVEIASQYTDKIFRRENYPMLNINKNFGFSMAANEWILSLDSDERVVGELSEEILNLDSNVAENGFFMPRKNIIFGKWIEHTGWFPDPQLRLFRKDKGKFEEKHVHEFIKVDGKIGNLSSPLLHLNYDNVDQFLNKMIKTYTVAEAESLREKGYKYNSFDIVKMPFSEFLKRYFAEEGYKDGMHGLVLSLLMSFYHFVVFLRLWEMSKYPDENDMDKLLKEGKKTISQEFKYWIFKKKIDSEENIFKKNTLKIKRKILS